MNNDDERAIAVSVALSRLMQEKGFNQSQLAKKLGASQATISKLLSRKHVPRTRLLRRIEEFLGDSWPAQIVGSDEWIKMVVDAAQSSRAFNDLIVAGLTIMNKKE